MKLFWSKTVLFKAFKLTNNWCFCWGGNLDFQIVIIHSPPVKLSDKAFVKLSAFDIKRLLLKQLIVTGWHLLGLIQSVLMSYRWDKYWGAVLKTMPCCRKRPDNLRIVLKPATSAKIRDQCKKSFLLQLIRVTLPS